MTREKRIELVIIFILLATTSIMMNFIIQSYSIIDLKTLLFWFVLSIVAETYLVEGPSGITTSVGMSVYLAIIITANPLVAVLCAGVGIFFSFPVRDGKRMTFVTERPYKTLFNLMVAGLLMAGFAGLTYDFIARNQDNLAIVVIAAVAAVMVAELFSAAAVSLYMYFVKKETTQFPGSLLGVLPSTFAVGLLGMMLAFAMNAFGEVGVALFFVPLLLARYSFKLYFDSQKVGIETIHALNEALCVRDAYTGGHTSRVEKYSLQIAKACGYSKRAMEQLKTAAFLHDIGKIGIPDSILNKQGRLTNEEYEIIKSHSAMGAQILSNVDSLKKVANIVKYHHERPDGKGYPDGLRGDAIPRDAAILAIADTYDAMTTDRPYRKGLSKAEAIAELEKYKGQQFDLDLSDIFIGILKDAIETEAVLDAEETGEPVL